MGASNGKQTASGDSLKKRNVPSTESLNHVKAALEALNEKIRALPENNITKDQLTSVCRVANRIVQDYQPVPPLPDALAMITQLPEAFTSCRPPLIARRMDGAVLGPASSYDPLPPPLERNAAILLAEWGYDIWTVDASQLPALAFQVLCTQPEIHGIALEGSGTATEAIDRVKLWRYVQEISRRYHSRPFHNLRHAVDVLLGTASLMRIIQRSHPELFSEPLAVACLLISAFVHDVDHPGCMNNFLIATNHPLAVLYNCKSVLENHHAATAVALLQRSELNFLSPLSASSRQQFISRLQSNVLATDVTTTLPAVRHFGAVLAEGGQPSAEQMAHLVIKAADISNPSRAPFVYQKWIDAVMLEFFAQGDAERQLGLSISINCDREAVHVAKAQYGFITFLVAPIFKALCHYAPGVQPIVEQLESNQRHFEAEIHRPPVRGSSPDALRDQRVVPRPQHVAPRRV